METISPPLQTTQPTPTELVLTEEQQTAVSTIIDWFNNSPDQEFKLGGYAGTGKTTIIRFVRKELEKQISIVVCAFTGKAVNVLNKKKVRAQTIHSLIYNCHLEKGELIVELKSKYDIRAKLIIIDEASMISSDLYSDLKSFGIKLLFVGDPGQLPPIGNNPNLMGSPNIVLSKIHRQAEKSPIITLANKIRLGGILEYPISNELIIRDKKIKTSDFFSFDQCICARNKTRETINEQIRRAKAFEPFTLQLGEKIIVLRNNLSFNVFNGLILFVTQILGESKATDKYGHSYSIWRCHCKDEIDNEYRNLPIWKDSFVSPESIKKDTVIPKCVVYATYAYVITCHKSQGSEWDKLLVFDEWMPPQVWDMKRWRYTAITRAAEHLTYCK